MRTPRPPMRPVPAVRPVFLVPLAPMPVRDAPCAAFRFSGALGIKGGRAFFESFTLVSDTVPYGKGDPLTSWKLIQFGSFTIDVDQIEEGRSVTVPVHQAVNMLVLDPFSSEMLLSARWQIDEIEIRGRAVSINSRLERDRKSACRERV